MSARPGSVRLLLAALLLLAPASLQAQSHDVEGLGALSGYFGSEAADISDDGRVIVGSSSGPSGYRATLWLELEFTDIVSHDLGTLPEGGNSSATAVNADGTVAVGFVEDEAGLFHAFRWTELGGLQELAVDAIASDVSADGNVVVGAIGDGSGTGLYEAYRWTSGGGLERLGTLSGLDSSGARGVSADGLVVVGQSSLTGDPRSSRAFRWSESTGMEDLGVLPVPEAYSYAFAASADGSVVVGGALGAEGTDAFRWTRGEGLVALGLRSAAHAEGVSADGRVITGLSHDGLKPIAFRWEEGSGMVPVGSLNCGGRRPWDSSWAHAVSADGRWIAGEGDSSLGGEAFRARLARPCASHPSDVSPGELDESTDPPTWRAEGDGRVDVADLVVTMRAAVGLHALDCEP